LTVDKAISISGGFTERASRSKIYVVHDQGTSANQRKEDDDKIAVKLFDVIQPGDVITVDQSFF
jgi:protein involved in polysaccharide export with SLBB domain